MSSYLHASTIPHTCLPANPRVHTPLRKAAPLSQSPVRATRLLSSSLRRDLCARDENGRKRWLSRAQRSLGFSVWILGCRVQGYWLRVEGAGSGFSVVLTFSADGQYSLGQDLCARDNQRGGAAA